MLLQGPIIADAEKRLAFLLAILHYFARLTTVVMGSGLRHGVHTAGGAGGLIGFRFQVSGTKDKKVSDVPPKADQKALIEGFRN